MFEKSFLYVGLVELLDTLMCKLCIVCHVQCDMSLAENQDIFYKVYCGLRKDDSFMPLSYILLWPCYLVLISRSSLADR